ncbi:MAG: hypothetical protein WC975_16370 [Phycisphaerae bacterium]
MTKKPKPIRYRIQCAKCGQTDPGIGYRQLVLTDIQGAQNAYALLCPACLQMFWLVYDGFIQTRPAQPPAYTKPPAASRAAAPYHRQRHTEAIGELKHEILWHRQAIRHLREMPNELFVLPAKPLLAPIS